MQICECEQGIDFVDIFSISLRLERPEQIHNLLPFFQFLRRPPDVPHDLLDHSFDAMRVRLKGI